MIVVVSSVDVIAIIVSSVAFFANVGWKVVVVVDNGIVISVISCIVVSTVADGGIVVGIMIDLVGVVSNTGDGIVVMLVMGMFPIVYVVVRVVICDSDRLIVSFGVIAIVPI